MPPRRSDFCRRFADGASRTRTGDLLGAISVKGVATNRNSLQFGRFMRVSGPCASASIAIFRDRRLTKFDQGGLRRVPTRRALLGRKP